MTNFRMHKALSWLKDAEVHLVTVHGSHLYGLAHADSDNDMYTVADLPMYRPVQSVDGDDDNTIVPLDAFFDACWHGQPKALEALWSPTAVKSPLLVEFSRTFRVGSGTAQDSFRRTREHLFRGENINKMKSRRHALRLAVQLRSIMETGRFNPVLNDHTKFLLTRVATRYDTQETFIPVMNAWFDWASDVH
jgi:predicted nucleotidyltransferase